MLTLKTVPKEYEVDIQFSHRTQYGQIAYKNSNRPFDRLFKTLIFETAVEYTKWQVSLIFWLIEGEDTKPR